MEKISRIVSGSPRVTSVNMSDQRPVRKSVPNFGQPVTESSPRQPSKSALIEGVAVYNELYGPAARKMSQETLVAKKLGEEFFKNQARPQETTASAIQAYEESGEGEDVASNETIGISEMEVETSDETNHSEEAPKRVSIRV